MSAKKNGGSPASIVLYDVAEVAGIFRNDPSTVRRMLAEGKLPGAFQLGEPGHESTWRIPPSAVDAYIRERQEAAAVKAPVKRPRRAKVVKPAKA